MISINGYRKTHYNLGITTQHWTWNESVGMNSDS